MLLCKDENEFRDLIALTAEDTKYEEALGVINKIIESKMFEAE